MPPFELDPTGIVALVLLPIIVVTIFLAIASAALLAVEAAIIVLAAFFWRGRWIVEAVTDGPPPERIQRDARGWRESRRTRERLEGELGG